MIFNFVKNFIELKSDLRVFCELLTMINENQANKLSLFLSSENKANLNEAINILTNSNNDFEELALILNSMP